MIVHDKNNRELEIDGLSGAEDDIQIDSIYYTDNPDEEVSDEVVDYIMDTYAAELYNEWFQNQVCAAEYAYDAMMDR